MKKIDLLAIDELLAVTYGLKLHARPFHDPYHRLIRACGTTSHLAHPWFDQKSFENRLPGFAAIALPPAAPLTHHQADVGGAVPVVPVHRGGSDRPWILPMRDQQKAVAASREARQVGRAALGRVLVEALVAEASDLRVFQPGQVGGGNV